MYIRYYPSFVLKCIHDMPEQICQSMYQVHWTKVFYVKVLPRQSTVIYSEQRFSNKISLFLQYRLYVIRRWDEIQYAMRIHASTNNATPSLFFPSLQPFPFFSGKFLEIIDCCRWPLAYWHAKMVWKCVLSGCLGTFGGALLPP